MRRNALMQDTVKLPPVPGDTKRLCGPAQGEKAGIFLVYPMHWYISFCTVKKGVRKMQGGDCQHDGRKDVGRMLPWHYPG